MFSSVFFKTKKRLQLTAVLLITLSIFSGISCVSEGDGTAENAEVQNKQDQFPLIYHMSFMNRFAAKLYFAGEEGNWSLADIYAHEVEEIAETIIDGKYDHDDVNISQLLEAMLLPALENVEDAIDSQDPEGFRQQYQTMIQTCNQCHVAADYNEIKVTVPESGPFNQDFTSSPD